MLTMYNRWRIGRFLFLFLFYVFLYAPIIVFVVHSFNASSSTLAWGGFTLEWYKKLFFREDLLRALYYSLVVALSAVCLVAFFCIISVGCIFFKPSVHYFLYGLYSSVFVPEIVLAIASLLFFMSYSIPLGLPSLIIVHTVMGIGYAFPLVYQRLTGLDMRLIEAAYDLGASRMQAFLSVILPLLKPTLLSVSLLVFILSFDDFLLAYFCSGSEIQTLPLAILSMLRIGITPDFNALATLLFIICAVGVLMYYLVGGTSKRNCCQDEE